MLSLPIHPSFLVGRVILSVESPVEITGTFTYTAGDEINNRPIYRQTGGTAYLAVKTVSSPSLPNWIGSNTALGTQPGSGAGFLFEKDYLNPQCPHAVSNWRVYLQTGETIDDPTFKVECAVGK